VHEWRWHAHDGWASLFSWVLKVKSKRKKGEHFPSRTALGAMTDSQLKRFSFDPAVNLLRIGHFISLISTPHPTNVPLIDQYQNFSILNLRGLERVTRLRPHELTRAFNPP
jgi:hypothetical protein